MIQWRTQLALAAVAALGAMGVAHAAPAPAANVNPEFNQCARLPLSQRGICRIEAIGRNEPAATQRVAANEFNASERAYQAALASCNRLPLSQRGICKEQALSRRETARAALTPSERAAVDSESTRFQTALAKCSRLPLSQRGICRSDAGLTGPGSAQG